MTKVGFESIFTEVLYTPERSHLPCFGSTEEKSFQWSSDLDIQHAFDWIAVPFDNHILNGCLRKDVSNVLVYK